MEKITLEKTHALLEKLAEHVMNHVPTKQEVDAKIDKLAEYVMNEIPTKREVDAKIGSVDEKIDRLANYVLNEIPAIKKELEQKADKKDVQTILEGKDEIIKQLDIIRTEQIATSATLDRHEQRLDVIEAKIED